MSDLTDQFTKHFKPSTGVVDASKYAELLAALERMNTLGYKVNHTFDGSHEEYQAATIEAVRQLTAAYPHTASSTFTTYMLHRRIQQAKGQGLSHSDEEWVDLAIKDVAHQLRAFIATETQAQK